MDVQDLFDKAINFINESLNKEPIVKVLHQSPYSQNTVKPINTSFYIQRGWIHSGNGYYGYFKSRYGAWAGEIVRRGDIYEVFIIDPPVNQLKNHHHWMCFHESDGNKYSIHLIEQPVNGDVGAIILFVERLINVSFQTF